MKVSVEFRNNVKGFNMYVSALSLPNVNLRLVYIYPRLLNIG